MPANFYGDQKQTAEIAAGAPIAKTPDVRPLPPSDVREAASTKAAAMAAPTPLFAPTQRPNEPVTHGIDVGPGAGSDALMLKQGSGMNKLSDTLAKMLPYDTDGSIAILYQNALARGN